MGRDGQGSRHRRAVTKHSETGKLIDLQVRKGTVDSLGSFCKQHSTQEAAIRRRNSTAADCPVVFGPIKMHPADNIGRVRQQFEVNMREFERERLARLDVYGRVLEFRTKKRNRG